MTIQHPLTEAELTSMSKLLIEAVGRGDGDTIADLISRGADPYVGYLFDSSQGWETPVWWVIKNTDCSMLPHLVGTNLKEIPRGGDRLGREGDANWDVISVLANVDRDQVNISRAIDAVRGCMEPDSPILAAALTHMTSALSKPGAAGADYEAGQRLVSAVVAGAPPPDGRWQDMLNVPISLDSFKSGDPTGRLNMPLLKFLLWGHEDHTVAPILTRALQSGYDPNTMFDGVSLLHLATAGNHVACAQALLHAGADMSATCSTYTEISTHKMKTRIAAGMTALDFAIDIGAHEIISLIEATSAQRAIDRVISAAGGPRAKQTRI